jgi:hypothetical protein
MFASDHGQRNFRCDGIDQAHHLHIADSGTTKLYFAAGIAIGRSKGLKP